MSKKDADEIEEFLNSAHGKVIITINGLSEFTGIKLLETLSGNEFHETISLMKKLQQVLGSEVFDGSAQ